MRIILWCSLLFFIGCISPVKQVASEQCWKPSSKELAEIEPLIRHYIFIPLEKYRREYLRIYKHDERLLNIAFFNPDRFPKVADEVSLYVSGGFPNFFTIEIDMERAEIVGHNASRL